MHRFILFTQCLQNDFVAPVPAGAPTPNQLHIGRKESLRLVGEDSATGPMGRFLEAFYAAAGPEHRVVHIRDWHDAADPAQKQHLEHFGLHCLKGTKGAEFVEPLERLHDDGVTTLTVNSTVLNDFEGTDLRERLKALIGEGGEVTAGIVGVWTDVKVQYLAYDLLTRLGITDIVVCSALTASRSRVRHFQALDFLAQNLAVQVVDGIPEFLLALGGGGAPLTRVARSYGVDVRSTHLEGEDLDLVRHLFRNCRSVELTPLSGGFSGARVFRTRSVDQDGREEVPFVVKMDALPKIARERAAVERIENVLGSSAPAMADFADLRTRGAIKYFFASMHHSPVQTLQSRLRAAATPDDVRALFRRVWVNILSRLSQSPVQDRLQLFQHYQYRPDYAASTLARCESLGASGLEPLRAFYARLPELLAAEPMECGVSWVHGDLNLANVLMDDAGNSWLIDYFHTGLAHSLKDIAKLENDLKYIMLPIEDEAALKRAAAWEELLMSQKSLAEPPGDLPREIGSDAALAKIHAAVREVRSWARELSAGVEEMTGYLIALLRYSAHTTGFEECSAMQRRHACLGSVEAARRLGATSPFPPPSSTRS